MLLHVALLITLLVALTTADLDCPPNQYSPWYAFGLSCKPCPTKCTIQGCTRSGSCIDAHEDSIRPATHCVEGYYGTSCDRTCPSNCLFAGCTGNGRCIHHQAHISHCVRGKYGSKCDRSCPSTCSSTCDSEGRCPSDPKYVFNALDFADALAQHSNLQLLKSEKVALYHAMTQLLLATGEDSSSWRANKDLYLQLDRELERELGKREWERMKERAMEEYERDLPGVQRMRSQDRPCYSFSSLAYNHKEAVPDGAYHFQTAYKNQHRQISFKAFIMNNNELFIAYTGSLTPADFVQDFKVQPLSYSFGKIHRGFFEEYQKSKTTLNQVIARAKNQFPQLNRITFTGHSLGGAQAQLAAFLENRPGGSIRNLIVRVVTFGAPAVGDREFSNSYTQMGLHEKTTHYINGLDPVVVSTASVGYVHVGEQINLRVDELSNQLGQNLSPSTIVSLIGSLFKSHSLQDGYGSLESDDDSISSVENDVIIETLIDIMNQASSDDPPSLMEPEM